MVWFKLRKNILILPPCNLYEDMLPYRCKGGCLPKESNMAKRKIECFSEGTIRLIRMLNEEASKFIETYNETKSWENRLPYRRFNISFSPLKGTKLGHCLFEEERSVEIALSEKLLNPDVSFEMLKQILGHEVAHMIDHLENNGSAHDKEFRRICEVIGVQESGASISKSLTEIEKTSSVMTKIKKLLALSESSNMNESQSALLKARQLMREYNVSERENSHEKIYRVALTKYKSYTADIRVISEIVKKITNVWVLLSQGYSTNTLYAHGTKTECEIADYMFDYLKRELEYLYKKEKKENNLSYGAKKSFYLGVLDEMRNHFSSQETHNDWGLIAYEEENGNLAKSMIYASTRLGKKTSYGGIRNRQAYGSGQKAGKNLRIYNGVTSGSSNNSGRLLS